MHEAAREVAEGILRNTRAVRGRFCFRNILGEIIGEAAAVMHAILPRSVGGSRHLDFLSLKFDLQVILPVIPGVRE